MSLMQGLSLAAVRARRLMPSVGHLAEHNCDYTMLFTRPLHAIVYDASAGWNHYFATNSATHELSASENAGMSCCRCGSIKACPASGMTMIR